MALVKTMWIDEMAIDLAGDEYNNFSYSGARALVEYLDDLSDDIWENIEFDKVAIRCDYSEYTKDELISDYWYKIEKSEYPDDDDYFDALLQELQDNTTVIEVDSDTFIIQSY